jgi:hypothetical protein
MNDTWVCGRCVVEEVEATEVCMVEAPRQREHETCWHHFVLWSTHENGNSSRA